MISLSAGIPLDLGFTAMAAGGDLATAAVTVYHLDSDARTVCEILRRPFRYRPVIPAPRGAVRECWASPVAVSAARKVRRGVMP